MLPKALGLTPSKIRLIKRQLLAYGLDLTAFAGSGLLAFDLRFDGEIPSQFIHSMWLAIGVWAIVKSVAFKIAKVNIDHWRHTSADDALRIAMANCMGSVLSSLILLLSLGIWGIPRSVYVLDCILASMFTLGGRLAVRIALTSRMLKKDEGESTRTLIYGAGSAGLALIWELRHNDILKCDVIGLIDDDPAKGALSLQGKKVLGTGKDLELLVRKHAIKRVLIAVSSATGAEMVQILERVREAQVEYKIVPSLNERIQGGGSGRRIRDVAVEDLLGRQPVHLDTNRIQELIQGKVVMVTGAAGSIGSELCRQIAQFNPLALVGFDIAETPLFQVDRELRRSFPDLAFHPEIGSITRPDALRRVMKKYQPSILYHAAAYKHVPLMEQHALAAIENNIFGTWQVASVAVESGLEDFVLISTDKAVQPTSMMGATKRVAELAIQALQQESHTKFVAVRFGNVLGSNGSVVPIFKEQIAAGGPVTVTHPQMSRYFMTIPEASQLVLQASCMGKGGEVFVLDMGEPVKIVDLAKNLILLSGLQPERDVKIQFLGLRPGEKLYEEVNLRDESLVPTSHAKIQSFVGIRDLDALQIRPALQQLQVLCAKHDVGGLVLLLKQLIPDYNPSSQLLQIVISGNPSHTGTPDELLSISGVIESSLADGAEMATFL